MSTAPSDSKPTDRNVVFKKLMPLPSKKPPAPIQKGARGSTHRPALKKPIPKARSQSVEHLVQENQKLKRLLESITRDFEASCMAESLRELERSRLNQFWAIAKGELCEKRETLTLLEQRAHLRETQHIEKIASLNRRICMLTTDATIQRVASTQTEAEQLTMKPTTDAETQEDEQKEVHVALQLTDEKLVELVTHMEREKLQALSEQLLMAKQMEYRLKECEESAMRRLRNDKEKQLEQLMRAHGRELEMLENKHRIALNEHAETVERLQAEKSRFTEEAVERQLKMDELKQRMEEADAALRQVAVEKEACCMERSELLNLRETQKRTEKEIKRLKNDLSRSEDIREIVLDGYRKVEKERDELIEEFERCVGRTYRRNAQRN